MTVTTTNIPPKLRGRLALYLTEADTGVYTGIISAKTREMLWQIILDHAKENSRATMIFETNTEAGLSFISLGEGKRKAEEFEGVLVSVFTPEKIENIPG